MGNKSVFIINGNWQYRQMFIEQGWEEAERLEEADLILFTGGEDVSPELYGERQHPRTWPNPARDRHEAKLFKQAVELGIPMVGICRGGQFLNVMNGGTMWQHVDNHAVSGTHKAQVTGFIGTIDVTSTHHQMMHPNDDVEHIVLVTARQSNRKERMGKDGVGIISRHTNGKEDDVESIFYPMTHSLCYQPHPEFETGKGLCRDVFFFFINNYLMNNLGMEEVTKEISDGMINMTHITERVYNAA